MCCIRWVHQQNCSNYNLGIGWLNKAVWFSSAVFSENLKYPEIHLHTWSHADADRTHTRCTLNQGIEFASLHVLRGSRKLAYHHRSEYISCQHCFDFYALIFDSSVCDHYHLKWSHPIIFVEYFPKYTLQQNNRSNYHIMCILKGYQTRL